MTAPDRHRTTNHRFAVLLMVMVVAMFGFGYALVPLYEVLCQITGLGGRTGVVDATEVESTARVDESRQITVRFLGTVNSALPWEFQPNTKTMEVHPGQLYEMTYFARNMSELPNSGVARPAVTPAQASLYFNKTECFCFTEQTFAPQEGRNMLVRFVISNELPAKINHITLSYTFFKS